MEKQCFKCQVVKSLDDFYKHPQMDDGHLNKCKECARHDVSSNYRAHKTQYQAYDRARSKRPERKEQRRREKMRRRTLFPERYRANNAVSNALRDGRLIRQPCEICGSPYSQGHHEDYSKPLDVRWLCFAHHRAEHGQDVTPMPPEYVSIAM